MAGLYGKNDQEKRDVLDSIFGSYTSDHALSKYELNKEPVPPEIAYRIVKSRPSGLRKTINRFNS